MLETLPLESRESLLRLGSLLTYPLSIDEILWSVRSSFGCGSSSVEYLGVASCFVPLFSLLWSVKPSFTQGGERGERWCSEETCMQGEEIGEGWRGSIGETFIEGGVMVEGEGRARDGGDGFCGHSLFLMDIKKPWLIGGVCDFLLSWFSIFVRNELQRRLDFLLHKGDEGEERQSLVCNPSLGTSKSAVIGGVSGVWGLIIVLRLSPSWCYMIYVCVRHYMLCGLFNK